MTTRNKLVVAALALAGVALFVVAGFAGRSNDDDASVRRTEGIVSIQPGRGDEVLKQAAVGVQLETEYRLVSMRIFDNPALAGGVDVTAHVQLFEGLNDYVYTPAEGRPVEELSPDDNCAVVRFEDITRPGEISEFDWCFTAS